MTKKFLPDYITVSRDSLENSIKYAKSHNYNVKYNESRSHMWLLTPDEILKAEP